MIASLRKNIDWVGYVDWTVRDFHSFDTFHGATYNSFLIRDKKTALIDAVKGDYAHVLLQNIRSLVSLDAVDYVICNHAEPDHSGGMSQVMAALPRATLVCDAKCREALASHHDTSDWSFRLVGGGDSLSLGERTLHFIETPMVHWPESMFTYVPEEKLLFSMDAFGQHYACSQRFDDELPADIVMEEAKKYYANIIMPYGKPVRTALKKIENLDIDMIAPSHGVIFRSYHERVLKAYGDWALCKPAPKVMVIYDTMWNATGEMAGAIVEGAARTGVTAVLIPIRGSNLTNIATEILDTAAVAFGSSTLNSTMMPMAAAVLAYFKGLRPTGKAAFAFGSYGWGKGGPQAVDEGLKALKWETLREPLMAQYRPTPAVLQECHEAGRMLAEKAVHMAAATASQ